VAVDGDFRPDYQIIEGKKKLIAELKAAAKKLLERLLGRKEIRLLSPLRLAIL